VAKRDWRSATSAGLLSYTMGLLLHVSLVQLYKDDKALLDMVVGGCFFITTVPTIVGISLAVYLQGRWSDWWGYYEQYVMANSVFYRLTMLILSFRWPKIESEVANPHDNDHEYRDILPSESQITDAKQHPVYTL